GNVIEKQTGMVYEAYERRLRASNAMDFDDLLLNMIVLLRNNSDVLKKYGTLFKYILVDEYQDTNRAQYIVINMLAKEHKNLCVVGDDAQSIYRWRGAEIRNILEFQNDYPGLTTIKLEQNYRSTKTILAAADSVIKNNRNQLPKTLFTENEPGDKIEIIPCSDEKLEADRICKIIKKTISESEHRPKDFAVLYRTNAQSLALEYSLRKNKLPYVIVGGLSFYKRKEIKDAVSYLKLLFNPSDGAALLRVINEPPRGIGLTSLRHIRAFADMKNISLFDAFRQADSNGGLQSRAKKAAANFTAFIDKYISMKEDSSPSQTAIEFIEASGILKMYKDIGTDDSLDRWNNIQQLLADISDFFRKNKEAVFEDYLQQIALMSDIDEKE
ncbi:MAG: UvrD-helicase domain-containing protein, partial [Chlorobi bacterium]|nr:UvrD-helicase domain-containing protein [Chlorobiota bacterium]